MSTKKTEKPKILCVDDNEGLVAGMRVTLRKQFDVGAATGGVEALEIMEKDGPFAVIISDMRMPEMSGVELLKKAKEISPKTVRILLTGYAEMDSAIAAINQGQIFRYLSKPCSPPDLRVACEAAVEQYRLLCSEQELLDKTLRGCLKVLGDVLTLANPMAFGRGTQLRMWSYQLAQAINLESLWEIDVAAMLCRIGYVTLPDDLVENLFRDAEISEDHQGILSGLPLVSAQLLEGIPRLENVRESIRWQGQNFQSETSPKGKGIPICARILRIVSDYEKLHRAGVSCSSALEKMKLDSVAYDEELLTAFAKVLDVSLKPSTVEELEFADLRPGMVLAKDLVTSKGMLLMAQGQEITQSLLSRLEHMPRSLMAGNAYVVGPLPEGLRPTG